MAVKITQINPGLNWYNTWPRNVACPAKKMDDLVFIGGQLPMDSDDTIVGVGNVQEQARFALTKFKECVELAGGSMDDVVEVQSFHTDVRHIPAVLEVAKEFFKKSKPTWSAIQTSGLYKMAIDICFNGLAVLNAKTKDINPDLEWYAKPPWDVAVPCKVANDLVVMGQICALDEKGKIVGPGDIVAQDRHIFKKILQCMREAGGTAENIADINMYSRDQRAQLWQLHTPHEFLIKDKKAMPNNMEAYAGTCITMPGFFHEDIISQHHVYGVLGDIKKIPLGGWMQWTLFYPANIELAGLKVGRYVFFPGQVMFNPLYQETTLEEDIPSVRKQARYDFRQYEMILSTIGATMDNVAFIQPYSQVGWINPILEEAHKFFRNYKPVVTSVGHRGLYLRQFQLEVWGMAIVDEGSIRPYTD